MPFQKSAQTLKAKAHLSEVKTPVLIGVCAVALVIVVFIFQGVFDFFSADSLEILKSDTSSENGSTVDEQNETGDTGGSEDQEVLLYVHVSGAVKNSGVYGVPENTRVCDAIEKAGGFAEDAVPEALNLARILQDGEQIIVPTQESLNAGITESSNTNANGTPSSGTSGNGASGSGVTTGGKININQATQAELETLPGIGEVTAQKIIADREAKGAFSSVDDLMRVSGIGEKKFEALADLICV